MPSTIPVFTWEWPITFPGIREWQNVQDSRESGNGEPGNGHPKRVVVAEMLQDIC